MPMPDSWVDAIFAKLTLVYGVRFKAMYGAMSPDQIRSDWAHELDGIGQEAIVHALRHLPSLHPPNVLQFRDLCREAPAPMRALVPGPRGQMSPKVKAKLQQLLHGMRTRPSDPLAGARRLRAKEQQGILLTRVQREFWRIALRQEIEAEDNARYTYTPGEAMSPEEAARTPR